LKLVLAGLLLLLAAPREPDVAAPGDLWKKLKAPQPGEWLWSFPEAGQTFREYQDAAPVRGTAERRRIYLQPFPTRPPAPDLLPGLADFLAAFFGREVEVLPPRPLPPGSYVRERHQVAALRLAPHLVRQLPADGLFLLAVTDRDLFVGDLSQAYGWGSFDLRVGVMSTWGVARRGDPGVTRRRTVTLAAHEACHMLSLMHCTFYGCLMNGARTMEEADRRPALLCPVCRAKVCWNLGLDPLARYAGLAAAWERAGLAAEAARTREALAVTQFATEN